METTADTFGIENISDLKVFLIIFDIERWRWRRHTR
jgi:hypothetical protein